MPFILDVGLVDAPAGVTQEEGHTGFLHLPCEVLALIFIARRIQPSLSLVKREVEFCVLTNQSFSTFWACFFILKNLSRGKIPVCTTAPRFLHTSQRQKVSRLRTEPPGLLYDLWRMCKNELAVIRRYFQHDMRPRHTNSGRGKERRILIGP